MIQAYVAKIDGVQDPKEHPKLLERFPNSRKNKILSYARKEKRIQSYGASLLLQRILHEHGKSLEDIFYGAHGKPLTDDLFFSISHSGNRVMCVVSSQMVGCDIEKINEGENLEHRLEKIAKRFFSKREVQELEDAQEERKKMFYRIWTMKESYVKMTGEGLTIPLDCMEFDWNGKGQVYRNGELCQCTVHTWEMDGYRMSVCGEEELIEIRKNEV